MRRAPARSGVVRAAVLGAALTLLLLVVAIASGDRRGTDVGDARTGSLPVAVIDYAFTLVVLFLLVFGGVIVWALSARGIGDLPPARRPNVLQALVLAAACLLLVVAAQGMRRPQPPPPDEIPFGPAEIGEAVPQPPQAQPQASVEERGVRFRWELAAVAAAIGGGLVAVYLVRRRGRDGAADRGSSVVEDLSSVVSDSIEDLESERDARRAVIAAYARMEAALAVHGLPRQPFEAPLEYLARILLGLRVRAEAVLDLTELFERAKFSRHAIDAEMKQEAISALVAVRDDLRAAS